MTPYHNVSGIANADSKAGVVVAVCRAMTLRSGSRSVTHFKARKDIVNMHGDFLNGEVIDEIQSLFVDFGRHPFVENVIIEPLPGNLYFVGNLFGG